MSRISTLTASEAGMPRQIDLSKCCVGVYSSAHSQMNFRMRIANPVINSYVLPKDTDHPHSDDNARSQMNFPSYTTLYQLFCALPSQPLDTEPWGQDVSSNGMHFKCILKAF
ncbi:hypothetical protein P152DRAFT_456340 [Eremomyces bilateralis CBS 781.70]|uniref:Uncharacterized protein n=1 Tax=Eremomyces bilateralis CBS 781.70 TaxID=1392243 RepID=A0A6G1G7R8_9PEZI|nr:uncharacterized protein P152DRAFT_456340 [Eremomyces bilateralis CBS 781.70]KAF1814108.1 hypothetical protein P152DRAFT_456340 [Eremomyces bilateralis CBS 781.70]